MTTGASNAVPELVVLDGAAGEGGGQIVRSALTLSLVTGRPFRIDGIRARRKKPGLLAQHLTAVRAAATIGGAEVTGAELGSRTLTFAPHAPQPLGGRHRFAIGTAGSTTLVAQTLVPALWFGATPADIVLTGGTHNPLCPPYDALARSWLPALQGLGPGTVDVELEQHGFAPTGGGSVRLRCRPGAAGTSPVPFERLERGAVRRVHARCVVADLPEHIATREADVVRAKLARERASVDIECVTNGPGNIVTIDVETDAGTEVFSAVGQIRVPAERVAGNAVREVKAFLRSGAAVGGYLADQLLVPLALRGGGVFRSVRPTSHTETNARVVRAFLPATTVDWRDDGGTWIVRVSSGDD